MVNFEAIPDKEPQRGMQFAIDPRFICAVFQRDDEYCIIELSNGDKFKIQGNVPDITARIHAEKVALDAPPFMQLTNATGGDELYLAVNSIISVRPGIDPERAVILVPNGIEYYVRESVNTVMTLMKLPS